MSLFKGEVVQSPSGTQDTNRFLVSAALKNAEPVTAGNYTTFFVAPFKCRVVSVSEIHGTASSSGTLDITKDTGTGAPQSGTSIFAAGTFNTAATANTLQTKTNISSSVGVLAAGDRLAMKNGGTLTSGANLAIVVMIEAL